MLKLKIAKAHIKPIIKRIYFVSGITMGLFLILAFIFFGSIIDFANSSVVENAIYVGIAISFITLAYTLIIETNNYEEVGCLTLDKNRIILSTDETNITLKNDDIRLLNIRIMGYVGQNIKVVTKTNSAIESIISVKAEGYKNFISIKSHKNTFKFYFLLENKESKDRLIELINTWKASNKVWLNDINRQ